MVRLNNKKPSVPKKFTNLYNNRSLKFDAEAKKNQCIKHKCIKCDITFKLKKQFQLHQKTKIHIEMTR